MTQEIDKRKEIAAQAATEAGRVLSDNFKKAVTVKSKGGNQLVTEVDLMAEAVIINLIKKNFPDDGILSEESPRTKGTSGFTWIIDPMDGTHNFIHGIDIFGTSIGVALEKEVVAGAICMPLCNELYVTQKHKGAYCNDKKLSVSKRTMKEATLIYDSSIRLNKKSMLKSLDLLSGEVFNIRMLGSSARHLTYVAEGKAEIDLEFNDKVWDFAAGLLMVEESGGIVTDFKGLKWDTDTHGYLATNGIVHDKALSLLKESL